MENVTSNKTKTISINKYRTKREMNIGIIVFAVIFIYLLVTISMFAFRKKVSVYEVREGSILRDNSYTGIALRREVVIPAEKTGYVHYFHNNLSKMKVGVPAYAITSNKISNENNKEDNNQKLSLDEQKKLESRIHSFNESFQSSKFSDVYALKNDISHTLQNSSSETKITKVESFLKVSGKQATIFPTTTDGIVLHNVDGFEGLTIETFKKTDLDRKNYKNSIQSDNAHVKKGDPIYKVVLDNRWSIIIPIDRKVSKELKQMRTVNTRLDKNNNILKAKVDTFKKDGEYYAVLNYNASMIEYASDRFINVELIFDDETGLKIPKSSIAQMDAYLVPKSFITHGGNNQAEGVMVVDEKGERKFQICKIYKETPDDMVYIGVDHLKFGTILEKEGDSQKLTLSYPKKIEGVYQINRGYAVFTQITILYESDDYCIVDGNNNYGLRNYDHIIQEGDTVTDGEIVF